MGEKVSSVASPSSYMLYMEHPKLHEESTRLQKEILPLLDGRNDVVGVAFAVNGRFEGSHVYLNPSLMKQLWPKLSRGCVIEALSRKNGKQGRRMSYKKVHDLIEKVKSHPVLETRKLSDRVQVVTRGSKEDFTFSTLDTSLKDASVHECVLVE